MKVFNWLIGSVTLLAIDKLSSEWKVIDAIIANQDTLGACDCEILHQYSLPCKHFLLKGRKAVAPCLDLSFIPAGG